MSAISPKGRLVFRLHDKRITSVEVIDFLKQLLRQHPGRHVVVVMDQARPHTSKMTKAFIESRTRLHVFYLPAYSPDWNPDEKVWNHLKNHELKAHRATNKQELYELTKEKLENMSDEISSGEMPLKKYTRIHADARLTEIQRKELIDWLDAEAVQLKGVGP